MYIEAVTLQRESTKFVSRFESQSPLQFRPAPQLIGFVWSLQSSQIYLFHSHVSTAVCLAPLSSHSTQISPAERERVEQFERYWVVLRRVGPQADGGLTQKTCWFKCAFIVDVTLVAQV